MSDHTPAPWRDWNNGLERFDLSASNQALGDVVGKLIGGEYRQLTFHRNFLRCAFRNATLESVNFSRADWKDDSLIDCEFVDADLSDSSTVSSTYSDCRFIRCTFKDAAFHECLYQGCVFVECDFSHSMIRNSLLDSCRFERCITSNKLFEGCRLFSNRFEETSIDFAAILDNFGLDAVQLAPSQVRENRSYPSGTPFPFDESLIDPAWQTQFSPFEQLKLQYYILGGELLGSDAADKAFEPETWLAQVRAPVNLVRLLQDFGDFVIRLYDGDRIPAVFMLKLASLSHSVWQGFTERREHTLLSQAGAGMYLQCVRELSDLDGVISNVLAQGLPDTVTLQSFDDASDDEISALAYQLQAALPDAEIRVKPRNSPVDLVLGHLSYGAAVFLLTLFFGTKTKIELVKLRASGGSAEGNEALLAIAIGGAKKAGLTSALSIQTAMPGAITLRIDVSYSSALVEKLRKVVKQAL
jgi:hypothetical protein